MEPPNGVSSPPPPTRRERRHAEIRERLSVAAMNLFMERGLDATTIKDITDAADVGKGTFFNYFATKEQVLAVFYERQLSKEDAALQAAEQGSEPVRNILASLAQRTAEQPGRSQAMTRSFLIAILGNSKASEVVRPLLEKRRKKLEELFSIGQRRGEIRRDCTPAALARMSQELAFGTALFWSLKSDAPLDQLLTENFQLFLSTRQKPAQSSNSSVASARVRQRRARRRPSARR